MFIFIFFILLSTFTKKNVLKIRELRRELLREMAMQGATAAFLIEAISRGDAPLLRALGRKFSANKLYKLMRGKVRAGSSFFLFFLFS